MGLQIQGGPYVSMGVSGINKWDISQKVLGVTITETDEAKIRFFNKYENNDLNSGETAVKRFDYGIYAGLGYKLGPIKLNAGYQVGLKNLTPERTDLTNFNPDDTKVTHRNFCISAAFIF